ncbi:type VI secretion system Vgr family protein [Rugamonas sp.]|uniref:type VI secretion system Vgr family protein n=1 Tax=Rugamonas sp. TaxID=1926287 RepID=UPI0025D06119|nr:type VI secretion system Vgr family protein [Rugamonas sp.]
MGRFRAVDPLEAAFSALGLDTQSNRLLRMAFPHDDGPDSIMLVNSLKAHEEVSRDFRFDVDVLSDDARIPLKAMMAKMVTISLVREDGSLRYFNGYVSQFCFLRADGGFAHYAMVLSPWLAYTRLHQDCVSFHGRSVLQITDSTLLHYRQHDWKTSLSAPDDDPQLSCANQYNETDYNHLHRRWEARGLHYWYEHRADGHTLWLSDDSRQAEPTDATGGYGRAPGHMAFRGPTGSAEGDGLRQWRAVRRLGAGSMALASFNYKRPVPRHCEANSLNRQGDVESYEWYEDTGSYGYRDGVDGERLAALRMAEHDQLAQYFEAGGNDRTAQPGRVFELDGHFSADPRIAAPDEETPPAIGDRLYLILSVTHTASNNYQAKAGAKAGAPSHYDNELVCIRQTVRWRPGRHHNSHPCPCPPVLTAIVVGPPGQDIYTDSLRRVRVQFHWDRLGQSNGDGSSWIRVATSVAGCHFGLSGIPRIGQEVVVMFMNGNIDHPLIINAVANAHNMPPWDLPGQLALSGWLSRELGGRRSNRLVLDDTAGQLQAQLGSDHQHSLLSLGYITRVEDRVGRQDARGQGFELRTDGHGVARAARGLLLTTEARPNAASTVTSMDETAQRLTAAGGQHQSRAEMARQHGALESSDQQGAVAAVLKAQNDAIRGQGGDFPELSAPHLVLASPAGIATTTAQSTHIASDEHTALTTGRSLSVATGDGFFASIGEALRVFVHKAGMKLVAASGKVTIAAQSDEIEAIANKVLSLISETDWVDIRGRKGVRLHGANCMLEISDKVQFFTSMPTLFHGNLETLAPQNRPQGPIEADHRLEIDSLLNEEAWVEFCLTDGNKPLVGQKFILSDPGGKQHAGLVNSQGIARVTQIKRGQCTVEFPDLGCTVEVAL